MGKNKQAQAPPQTIESIFNFKGKGPATGIWNINGIPGIGKTAFISAVADMGMRDRRRLSQTNAVIDELREGGARVSKQAGHCVFSTTTVTAGRVFRESKYTRALDPNKLGFNRPVKIKNKDGTVTIDMTPRFDFIPPYSLICIDDAQDFFDAHEWQNLHRDQKAYFEKHRHWGLLILMDCQDLEQIAKSIRRLLRVIEIQSCDVSATADGGPVTGNGFKTTWVIRIFQGAKIYEKYQATDDNEHMYVEKTVTVSYDVHKIYDSHSNRPEFLIGNEYSDFIQG